MDDDDQPLDLDLAAASLRADGGDVQVLVSVLVDKLRDALGARLEVERSGGRFRRPAAVRAVRVTLGNDAYELTLDGPSPTCAVGHVSAGIRIRTEQVDLDTWLARLLAALRDEAGRSQDVRQALEQLVIGGGT